MQLVRSFRQVVQPLAATMTAPTSVHFVTLITGWLFARRRTVTGMVTAAEAVHDHHFATYARVFAAARWSLDRLGLLVFEMAVRWADRVVGLTLDDTLARKRGKKVWGAGMHHDPLISSRRMAVKNWGHSWVVLAVLVRLPCCAGRVFSLPVLFRLYLPPKVAARWRVAHRTRPQLAVEMLRTLSTAYPSRKFHVRADSTYGCAPVLAALPAHVDLTSRLPLNARLHAAPAARTASTVGRPRMRGTRLPSPVTMLAGRCQRATLALYGRHDRVRIATADARWFKVPNRPLRVVAVDPQTGGRRPQAFFTTATDLDALDVLTGYAERWSVEEANQGSKSHLGFEEPQGWSRQAVRRTAPIAMLLYSLVVIWFAQWGYRFYRAPDAPWYPHKARASFADMLATLQRESLRATLSDHLRGGRLPRNALHSIFAAARFAA